MFLYVAYNQVTMYKPCQHSAYPIIGRTYNQHRFIWFCYMPVCLSLFIAAAEVDSLSIILPVIAALADDTTHVFWRRGWRRMVPLESLTLRRKNGLHTSSGWASTSSLMMSKTRPRRGQFCSAVVDTVLTKLLADCSLQPSSIPRPTERLWKVQLNHPSSPISSKQWSTSSSDHE